MTRTLLSGLSFVFGLGLGACQPNGSALPDASTARDIDGGQPAAASPDSGTARDIDGGQPVASTDAGGRGVPGDDAGSSDSAIMDPDLPGPYTFTTDNHTLEVGDASSSERVELHLFLPTGVEVAPIVLFHPGFQVSPENYYSYGEHLASQGICVIFVDPPDAIFGGPTHAEMASYLGAVLDWVEVENAAGRFGFAIDETKVGLAGHSMGGKLSMLFASQDSRPMAIAGLDPVDAAAGPFSQPDENNPSVTPERMSQVEVPLLLIGETLNGTCDGVFCQPCAPIEDNFQQYFEYATSPALEIEVLGANHMSFLDNPNCGFACSVCPAGTDDPAQTRRLSQKYVSAFFQLHLLGRTAARSWLVGENMDIDVQQNRVQVRVKNGF